LKWGGVVAFSARRYVTVDETRYGYSISAFEFLYYKRFALACAGPVIEGGVECRLIMIVFKSSNLSHSLFRLALGYLALVDLGGLDASHHLLLGDEMINALQQTQQALHVAAPLVQYVVCVSRLRECDYARGPVDFGVDGLCRHQLADVLLRLVFGEIQQLCQPRDLDACVVLGNDANVVLDDTLPQVLPPLVRLVVV